MAKRSLAELTEQFSKKTESSGTGNQAWKLFFPFWKAEMDTVSTIRFLPDLDENNPMGFLVENLTHDLFINGKKETVACLKMFDEDCPICKLSQKYYDEKSPEHDEKLGKKYYRKKSYIGQAIVIETPIEHDHDQLVKLIEFGPAIFKQIQAAFRSGDLEESPFELLGGYNFRIKKTKSGEYASYTTSSFAPKQTDVDDAVIARLELFNLADYRAQRFSHDVLEAMLIADQTGSSYGKTKADDTETLSLVRKVKSEAAPADAGEAMASEGTTAAPAAPAKPSLVEQLRARAAAARAAQGE